MKDLNSYVIDIIMEYKLDIKYVSTNRYWAFHSVNTESIEILKAIGTIAGFKVNTVSNIHYEKKLFHIHVDKAN